jgi:hypothetical protein
MREKVLSRRIRFARETANPWATAYARDVAMLRRLLVSFVIADAARAIAMDDYPGPSRAEKEVFATRVRAQRWLGAMVNEDVA